jgi:hypothetical protein
MTKNHLLDVITLLSGRRFGVGSGRYKSFVLISYQNRNHRCRRTMVICCVFVRPCLRDLLLNRVLSLYRINKRGSQKDMEQKRKGNYFFYEADDDTPTAVDDDDL